MTYAESKVEFAMITEKGYKGITIYGMTVNVPRKYFRFFFRIFFFNFFYYFTALHLLTVLSL